LINEIIDILVKDTSDKRLDSILTSTNLQSFGFVAVNRIGLLENNKSMQAQLLSICLMNDSNLDGKRNFKN